MTRSGNLAAGQADDEHPRQAYQAGPTARKNAKVVSARRLERFFGSLITDGSYDPKSVGVHVSLAELSGRIKRAYGISSNES
jgi:hypothetical protein